MGQKPVSREQTPAAARITAETRTELAQGYEGLDLPQVLHQTLGATVILLDEAAQKATLSGGANVLFGLEDLQRAAPIDAIPAPIRALAHEAARGRKPIHHRHLEVSLGTTPRNRHFRVTAIPLESGAAETKVVLVIYDFSAVREFEARLLQLERLASLGTLAASMAHEVKNALVACKTFIDLLLEKNPDGELVQIVRREMGRIDSIVTRTLKFAGRGTRQIATVHAHDILEHCFRLIERPMEDKGLVLSRSLDAPSDSLLGDEQELQQAFVNLFLNAVEAMGADGKLKVTTRLDPNDDLCPEVEAPQLWVVIEDSGPGIPAEIMPHLFEPFMSNKPNGTGLGLAITHGIIHQHRGTISARSTPGQGTSFTIVLPASAAAPEAT